MEIKAYALVKNDEMIGKFFDTKRSVEETYAKKLEDSQYSIGVFTFAGETEVVEESEYIELYTNKGGYLQWKRGWSFNADDVKDKWNEQYSEVDYIFKVQKKHVRKNSFWGGYMVDNTEHVDIMTPYKKPKPVEEEVKEEEDLEVEAENKKVIEVGEIEEQSRKELRATLQRYIHAIQPLPDLRPIARAVPRHRLVAEEMTVTQADSEGIIVSAQPRQYTTRPSTFWLDCLFGTDSQMPETKVSKEDKMPQLKLTQEDLDCPF